MPVGVAVETLARRFDDDLDSDRSSVGIGLYFRNEFIYEMPSCRPIWNKNFIRLAHLSITRFIITFGELQIILKNRLNMFLNESARDLCRCFPDWITFFAPTWSA